jgi:hypothetical protein
LVDFAKARLCEGAIWLDGIWIAAAIASAPLASEPCTRPMADKFRMRLASNAPGSPHLAFKQHGRLNAMERLAVIGGLIVAAAFALGALNPSVWDNVRIEVSGDYDWDEIEPVPAGEIFTLQEAAFAGERLVVTDAALRVEIIPEDRADFAVAIDNAGPLATPIVTADGGVVEINGQLDAGVSCRRGGDVVVHGRGSVDRAALPLVRVRAPRSMAVESAGANHIVIGDATAVQLVIRGCGDAVVGDVAQRLDLTVAGAGNVKAGRLGSAAFDLAGSGDVSAAAVTGQLQARIGGSAELTVAEAAGAAAVTVAGSGEARIGGGALTAFEGDVAGSGDISVDADVNGPATARVAGSGEISIQGAVETLNATVEGSGEVDVGAVRGAQTRIVRGSGAIEVGGLQTRSSAQGAAPGPASPRATEGATAP